jgi:antitoxin ParD1/3/4
MNVSLTPDLERLVQERIREGAYADVSEVIREGLEFFFSHEAELKGRCFFASSPAELERKLVAGVEELEAGRGMALNDARQWLEGRAKDRGAR